MKLHFGEAWGVLMKTFPCVLVCMVVYGVIGIGAAIYLGLLVLMAKVFGGAGAIVFIIGLGGLFGIMKLLQRYMLYLISAGHVAVITEVMQNKSLPGGQGQIEYGKQVVTGLFKEISVLFAVDQLVNGTIRGFNRTVVRVADILPIPGLDSVAKFAGMIVNYAVTYVDETILSFNLARKDKNIWESAKTGVVLYAQNWKPILANAAGLAVINLVGLVVLIVILLIPFGALAALTANQTLKAIWLFLAITLGYGLKVSIINPFCLISTIITYNRSIEGQQPNAEWEGKLEQASDKFRQLKDKARSYVAQ